MLRYIMFLMIGVLLLICAIYYFVTMYHMKDFSFKKVSKMLMALLLGSLLLFFTIPSLKYIVFKEYDVVNGKCYMEIDSSGRSAEADFYIQDTDEIYSFDDILELDAYGKDAPYYCSITVTKDHQWEIGYKIYEEKTKAILLSSE